LELARLLPGNFCTLVLAMLGADVIKVEDPQTGDYMRDFGAQVDGAGACHHTVNRAKRSVTLHLKSASDRRRDATAGRCRRRCRSATSSAAVCCPPR
jgi:alpha-methylacyl-CoA racemase